jgi:uncharacterized protein (TIGR02147 family)
MELKRPNVFSYQNYRTFLENWYAWKKSEHSNYSGAVFAKKADVKSHTLLGMVIRGKRNLSYKTIRAFLKALGLQTKENIYFEKLVLFNQSQSKEDKAQFFDELHSVSSGDGKKLLTELKDYSEFLSHWYVVAIRELAALEDFRPDAAWLVKKLKNKISKRQAQNTWNLLIKLGLVEKNKDGKWKIIHKIMDFDFGMIDFSIQHFHKEYLERTREAIENESLQERELSSLTISLTQEELEELKQKIKSFRKDINLSYTDDNNENNQKSESKRLTPKERAPEGRIPKHVAALNMQLLVLTEANKREESQDEK